jgi:hypothetical protein
MTVCHEREWPRGRVARNCLTDEGRPLGIGLQEQVPNHLRRLWTKSEVVNAEGPLADGCAAWLCDGNRMSREVHVRFCEGLELQRSGLLTLRRETDAQEGFADAEFGVVYEHGGAHAFFLVEGAVGGIQISQIDVGVAHFDDAMMPRNFGVL